MSVVVLLSTHILKISSGSLPRAIVNETGKLQIDRSEATNILVTRKSTLTTIGSNTGGRSQPHLAEGEE